MSRSTLLAGLPVRQRSTVLDHGVTTLLEGGEGPPVVLLHGAVETGGAYWAPLIPALAQRHRVVVPDVPGLGESEPFAGGRLDQAAFDAWFLELLDQTCEDTPAVIAHSMLGSVAARFAARYGHRLSGLTIYGAPGIERHRMPLGLAFAAIMFDLRPSLANQQRFLRWVFPDPARTRSQHPAWFDAFNEYCVERGRVPHVKRTMRQLIRLGAARIPDSELARISVPVALVWGRHDRMTPLHLATAAAATHGWPLHVIDGAGHAPHLDQPDAFLRVVQTLLPTRSAAGSRSAP